jgi:hypothetical protein
MPKNYSLPTPYNGIQKEGAVGAMLFFFACNKKEHETKSLDNIYTI